MRPTRASRPGRGLVLAAVLAATAAGCGGNAGTVTGKVTYDDGKPVTAGQVLLMSDDPKAKSVVGDIGPDGSFTLYTEKPGDGVPVGKYKVGVTPPGDDYGPKNPRPVDQKFGDPVKSPLPPVEVKPGANDLPLKVTRPK